jgi:4-amino-4-deoxy-L-arabinose transferase-like glycosyltransferase
MGFLRSTYAATAVVLGVAGLVLFLRLGSYALWDPDEGRHAEVAREVLASRDWAGWITPRLNDEPYREKQIFFYWATAAAYAVVGVNELGARLVSALAALATVIAIFAWSMPRWGPRAAALAAVVLVTSVEFIVLGRFASVDMLLTFFVTAGILAVERWGATAHPAWLLVVTLAAALGMLTKGLAAPVLIAVVGLVHLATSGRLALLRPRPLGLALLLFVAVVAPWHLTALRLDPDYLRQLYLEGHLGRFTGTERTLHHEPFWFYVPVLLVGFFPWSTLLPATLWRRDADPDTRLCLVWAAVPFVLFSASASKLGTYVLPCLPPLALLTGRMLDRALDGERIETPIRVGLWLVVGVFAIVPFVVVVLAHRAWDGALADTALLSLALLPVAAALGLALRSDGPPRALATVALGILFLVCGFYGAGAAPVSRLLSAAPLAETIARVVPTNDAVPVVAYAIRAPSLIFYLRRPIIYLARWRPLRKIVEANPLVLVVTSEKHRATIAQAGVAAFWATGGRRELWASQPLPGASGP